MIKFKLAPKPLFFVYSVLSVTFSLGFATNYFINNVNYIYKNENDKIKYHNKPK